MYTFKKLSSPLINVPKDKASGSILKRLLCFVLTCALWSNPAHFSRELKQGGVQELAIVTQHWFNDEAVVAPAAQNEIVCVLPRGASDGVQETVCKCNILATSRSCIE